MYSRRQKAITRATAWLVCLPSISAECVPGTETFYSARLDLAIYGWGRLTPERSLHVPVRTSSKLKSVLFSVVLVVSVHQVVFSCQRVDYSK